MVGCTRWIPVLSSLAVLGIAWAAKPSSPVRPATELAAQAPALGITVPCTVVEVIDGDTLTVEGTWRAKIRLKDVWAKELRDPGGDAALAHMQTLTKSRKCRLFILLEGARAIGDVMTFGRIVGEIWMDGKVESINVQMVKDGFATREKEKKR